MKNRIINVITVAGVVANAGYHHQEFIKVKLGLKPMPELIEPTNLPPEIPQNQENEIKNRVNEIRSKIGVKATRIEEIKALFYGNPSKVKGKFVPNGEGVLEYDDRRNQIGSFVDGLLEGPGMYHHPRDGTTIGNFKGGKVQGIGHIVTPTGEQYVGETRDNKPYGRGIMRFTNGNTCHVLKNEEKQLATCYSRDGKLFYDGEFNGMDAHGKGKLLLNEQGYVYEGEFVEGKRSGHGIERDAYGDLAYEGEYEDNMPKQKNIILPETMGYIGLAAFNIILSFLV